MSSKAQELRKRSKYYRGNCSLAQMLKKETDPDTVFLMSKWRRDEHRAIALSRFHQLTVKYLTEANRYIEDRMEELRGVCTQEEFSFIEDHFLDRKTSHEIASEQKNRCASNVRTKTRELVGKANIQ